MILRYVRYVSRGRGLCGFYATHGRMAFFKAPTGVSNPAIPIKTRSSSKLAPLCWLAGRPASSGGLALKKKGGESHSIFARI